mmetsp:Transcript_4697/g.5336  ORF Transcript_4697/g.5336 Transcript_4697/m.5336 type:complete len:105 (-) Transcript_4697:721-1035(-)
MLARFSEIDLQHFLATIQTESKSQTKVNSKDKMKRGKPENNTPSMYSSNDGDVGYWTSSNRNRGKELKGIEYHSGWYSSPWQFILNQNAVDAIGVGPYRVSFQS